MIIRTLEDIIGTDRDVHGESGTWNSRRLLLKSDNMGFALNDTLIHAGTKTHLWYKHHLEAVYCIEGEGYIEEYDSGVQHRIFPGMMYALDKHDRHWLVAEKTMRMICVFNPPLTGREDHDEDGAYRLIED